MRHTYHQGFVCRSSPLLSTLPALHLATARRAHACIHTTIHAAGISVHSVVQTILQFAHVRFILSLRPLCVSFSPTSASAPAPAAPGFPTPALTAFALRAGGSGRRATMRGVVHMSTNTVARTVVTLAQYTSRCVVQGRRSR